MLVLTYEDDLTIEVDFTPFINQGGVFAPLADSELFAKVQTGERSRFLIWPGDLEFCADALRIDQAAIVG